MGETKLKLSRSAPKRRKMKKKAKIGIGQLYSMLKNRRGRLKHKRLALGRIVYRKWLQDPDALSLRETENNTY